MLEVLIQNYLADHLEKVKLRFSEILTTFDFAELQNHTVWLQIKSNDCFPE